MTRREVLGCLSVFFVILITLLLWYLLILSNLSNGMQDVPQTSVKNSENSEESYNIEIKIEGKIHQGVLFPKRYVGFFQAREICRSYNMSLPHQGFEILQTSDFEQIASGGFWIDALINTNLSIVYPQKGSDTKMIKEMLEEALQRFGRKMLGKMRYYIYISYL